MDNGLLSETLIDYLLSCADGHRFESLVQALLGIRDGEQFVALGGVQDGGADGFLRDAFENEKAAGHFIQMSIQDDVSGKVRGTVRRLREVGRAVHTLTYWSANRLPQLDILEEKLTEFDNWKELPPERVEVKLSDTVDRLKFDRLKRYESNLERAD